MQALRSQTWIVAPHKLHSHQTEKSPVAFLPREGSCTWSARRRWPQEVSSWSRRQSEQNGHQILKLCIGKQPKREHCQKRNSTGEHHWSCHIATSLPKRQNIRICPCLVWRWSLQAGGPPGEELAMTISKPNCKTRLITNAAPMHQGISPEFSIGVSGTQGRCHPEIFMSGQFPPPEGGPSPGGSSSASLLSLLSLRSSPSWPSFWYTLRSKDRRICNPLVTWETGVTIRSHNPILELYIASIQIAFPRSRKVANSSKWIERKRPTRADQKNESHQGICEWSTEPGSQAISGQISGAQSREIPKKLTKQPKAERNRSKSEAVHEVSQHKKDMECT